VQDHNTVVTALERGDASAAEAALRQYLAGTLPSVTEMQKRHPDWIQWAIGSLQRKPKKASTAPMTTTRPTI
jgi:hypothetical protein